MEKITLIILFSIFAMSTSFAQNLDLRAYAGVNILQLTTDNGTSIIGGVVHRKTVSGRPGFQFGAGVTFGERFYVQPGFQYTLLSTKIINKSTVTGTEFKDESTLGIISVPLKFGFRLINPETEDLFNVRLFAGFDGYHVIKVTHGTKSGKINEITKDDYSNLIMNADFGIGLDISVFFLDVGYQLGLSPVHSSGDLSKANSFYTNLGFRLSF